MKQAHRILAMLLTLLIIASSLISCDLIDSLLKDQNGQSSPTPDENPPHTHQYVGGECDCGQVDPDYVKPHEHEFADGFCSCGERDPDYVFTHKHTFVNGECACGENEEDYEPSHKHNFVDGLCSCGEKDPDYVKPHECENLCDTCGGCLDAKCGYEACLTKCKGHPTADSGYGYLPTVSGEMPVISINTADGDNSWATKYNRNDKLNENIEYVDALISTSVCGEEYALTDVEAEVKVRGNYTLDYEKKPIRIKFGQKTNLFGLHEGEKYKNWVLLADWKDLSMTNNSLAFYLGNAILGSDGLYCTDFRNVEVYLNGRYWGVYLLVEQQEVKDGRTSVPEVEDDYTGNDIGYFFEYDGYYTDERNMADGDPTFEMNYEGGGFGGCIGYTVKSDIYADSQLEFLKSYMDNVYYIAYRATKGDFYRLTEDYLVVPDTEATDAREVIGRVINLDSLVGSYILNELACDPDVGWSSFYLSLDMTDGGSKKVNFEAPWDFDSCFGISNRGSASQTSGFFALSSVNPWFSLFAGQDWFNEMVCDKWAEMKENGVQDNAIWLIRTMKATYADYYTANYQRWPNRVNYGNGELVWELNTYNNVSTAQGLASDYLLNWFKARVDWLDGRWTVAEDNTPEIPENAVSYIYEAEDAELIGFVSDAVRYNRDYASGNAYVGRVDNGTAISFTVNASEDTAVHLCAGISKRSVAKELSALFSVTVNGQAIEVPMRILPAISEGEEDWHSFISLMLTAVELKAGENTIVFKTVSSDATNFDFIELYSTVELS